MPSEILVIHPEDNSTDFLRPIYQKLNATVITGGISKKEMMKLVEEHDRIMMMGHGCPNGLFAVNRFDVEENKHLEKLIIDESFTSLLKKKKGNMYIWCHADKFVMKHKLKGFFTGMFISEMMEALIYEIDESETAINQSNLLFSRLIGAVAHMTNERIHNHLKLNYKMENNQVCDFNYARLYLKK